MKLFKKWDASGIKYAILTLLSAGVMTSALAQEKSLGEPQIQGLYDVGGFKLHLTCYQNDKPQLILEQGFGRWGSDGVWDKNIARLLNHYSVCYYDRAGLGKSEAGPVPFTVNDTANRLNNLLQAADVKSPYYFAGASYAYYIVTAFQNLYPNQVQGITLIDPPPMGYFHTMATRWPKDFETSDEQLKRYYQFEQAVRDPLFHRVPENVDHLASYELLKKSKGFGAKPVIVVRSKKKTKRYDPPFVPDEIAATMNNLYDQAETHFSALSSNAFIVYSESEKHHLHIADRDLVVESIIKMKQISAMQSEFAFLTNRDGNHEVYLANINEPATNQSVINLTRHPATDFGLSWSPDGTQVLFGTNRDGNREIYRINADGSAPTNLTQNPAKDSAPNWSADGKEIVFVSDRDGSKPEVYIMKADGTEPKRLTNNTRYDESPSISPDGKKIVFGAVAPSANGTETLQIFIMDRDGANERQLTKLSGHNSAPRWSPDGKKIAFYGKVGKGFGGADIFVMDADGTNLQNLTNDEEPDWQPSWSDDGSWILYSRGPSDPLDLWLMSADGKFKRPVLINPGRDEMPVWRPVHKI